jgi:hypothetical protein
MDFTDLEEDARKAKLSFDEAESLVRFFNFQRARRGETPIPVARLQLGEQLSKIYPDIHFKSASHESVAQVKDDAGGSLVERIGIVSRHILHLATTVIAGSDAIKVVFRADGVGVIKDESLYEFFEHDINLEEIMRDFEGDRDSMDNFLWDHFEEHINQRLDDPFIPPFDEPWEGDSELHFEKGSKDELDRLMKLFILTEPDIGAREEDMVYLYAALEGESDDPHLDLDDDGYHSKRLETLVDIALSENRPVGWTWEYNDGAYNRQSGYDKDPIRLTWDIGEILRQTPARERMAARRDLMKWLEERDHDIARFDALSEGKGVE